MYDEVQNLKDDILRIINKKIDGNTNLAKRATAPATTGDATLVPDKTLQPDTRFEPRTNEPYVTKSGFIRP